jgi:hypothetical protein
MSMERLSTEQILEGYEKEMKGEPFCPKCKHEPHPANRCKRKVIWIYDAPEGQGEITCMCDYRAHARKSLPRNT